MYSSSFLATCLVSVNVRGLSRRRREKEERQRSPCFVSKDLLPLSFSFIIPA